MINNITKIYSKIWKKINAKDLLSKIQERSRKHIMVNLKTTNLFSQKILQMKTSLMKKLEIRSIKH